MPYVIPDDSNLNTELLHLNKLEVDELFNGIKLIPFDPFAQDGMFESNKNFQILEEKKNSKSEQRTPKLVSNHRPLEKTIDLEEIFKSLDGQNNKINPEEKKKWFITTSNAKNIGPYSGKEILMCLRHILIENSPNKNSDTSRNFMICDSESDIYYKPEAAYENLQREIPESSLTELEKNNFERQIKLNKFHFPLPLPFMHNLLPSASPLNSQNFIQRKLSGNIINYNQNNMIHNFNVNDSKFNFKTPQNMINKNPLQNLWCTPNDKENFDYTNFNNNMKNLPNFRKKSNENSRNKFDYPIMQKNYNRQFNNKITEKEEKSIYNI
jgi:hypothetical protein